MRKILKRTFGFIFFILGISMALYPMVEKINQQIHQTTAFVDYKKIEKIEKQLEEEAKVEQITKEFNEKLDKENEFLASLVEMSNSESKSIIDGLDPGQILGIVNIPKLNVYLPIYNGTTQEILLKGIGHMDSTSLPGQMRTHCLLTGHTGLSSNKMFDDIGLLELGDTFFVEYNGQNLAYKVVEKKIVEPDDTTSIKLYEDKELVTLVTCTPKYVNSHRLLVTGARVELVQTDVDNFTTYTTEQLVDLKTKKNYLSVGLVLLIVILIIYFVFVRRKSLIITKHKKVYIISENSRIKIRSRKKKKSKSLEKQKLENQKLEKQKKENEE